MESDFKSYPQTLGAKDYWGQVKRTVNGQPVSEAQIKMIVGSIVEGLELVENGHDILLDIGCGNGALSQLIFDKINEFHGVDYSEYLISVAKRDFERLPSFSFEVADALDYVNTEPAPQRFNKVLCYGCFSYFPQGESLLRRLYENFPNVSRVFIGNLPDRDRAHFFFKDGLPPSSDMDDFNSKIGIWRSQDEFGLMARRSGWECKCGIMPKSFYASHYRYDALLTRLSA